MEKGLNGKVKEIKRCGYALEEHLGPRMGKLGEKKKADRWNAPKSQHVGL